ncbi:hypothetical protein DY000_02053308 [Brassica cretica]|uniref:Uncharacterized protein n=1 Tax=Brassica cretica TaxID=69181 RepID=A0ABQ7AJW7_BRACR|nr:hypothetical protein DY000_02053308 [Brassica cretica]
MPQPKPSANPPETTDTHSEDAAEPMEVDNAPMGRTLRKRKEKVAKQLNGGANEKEMENFERESSIFHWRNHSRRPTLPTDFPRKSIDIHKEESIDSSPGNWENDYYNPTMAVHTATPTKDTLHTEEYDEDYEEERATEYRGIRTKEGDYSIGSWADDHYHESYAVETSVHERGVDEPHGGFTYEELLNYQERSDTDSLFTQACRRGSRFYRPFTRAKHLSINITASTSIDIRSQPPSNDIADILQIANGVENFFMQQHNIPEHQQRFTNEFYDTDGGVDDCFKLKYRQHTRPSIDIRDPTTIDKRPEFGRRAYDRDGTWRFHWEEKDEYGVYRDNYGHARDVDGHIIRVSKDDIISLLERASMDEHNYLCLPEHARSFTQTKLVPEIYIKDEINEMLYGVCGAQEKNEGDFQMKLDGVYYPLNDSISWLTTYVEEMRQDIARIQTKRVAKLIAPASIDRKLSTSIDDEPSHSNQMKSQPDSYTRAEIDQLSEAMQREIVEIQRYIARRPEASPSIDRRLHISTNSRRHTSIDEATPTNRGRLVPKMTSDMSDTNNHGEEISDDAYTTLIRNQFQLESHGERLQKIENATATMKDIWHKGDEPMRDFTGSWFNKRREEMETCFPSSPSFPHY